MRSRSWRTRAKQLAFTRCVNGLHNLNDVQRLRFFVQMFLIFRPAEQLHYYSIEGMVEDRVWRGFERQLTEVGNLPGVREWWKVRSFWFSDVFQEYIDGVIASGPVVEPQNHMGESCLQENGRWRGRLWLSTNNL